MFIGICRIGHMHSNTYLYHVSIASARVETRTAGQQQTREKVLDIILLCFSAIDASLHIELEDGACLPLSKV